MSPMRYGVLGTGMVGRTLATRLVELGNDLGNLLSRTPAMVVFLT